MNSIVRIPILPLKIVNAHLLVGSNGCVLVDAGLPGSAPKVERVLSKRGLTFADIKAIVITHAHVDHAGGAAELREKTLAPIIAHEDDLPYYRREKPVALCPTGRWDGIFSKHPFLVRAIPRLVRTFCYRLATLSTSPILALRASSDKRLGIQRDRFPSNLETKRRW